MLNGELKSWDFFPCDPVHGFEYSSPVALNCANTRVPGKQEYKTLPTKALVTRVRSHLMCNNVLWKIMTLDYFSCVPAHDFGYSDPVFSNRPNT